MAEIRFYDDENGKSFVEIEGGEGRLIHKFQYVVSRDQLVEEMHRYLGRGEFVDGSPCDDRDTTEVESLRRTVKAMSDVIDVMRMERTIRSSLSDPY